MRKQNPFGRDGGGLVGKATTTPRCEPEVHSGHVLKALVGLVANEESWGDQGGSKRLAVCFLVPCLLWKWMRLSHVRLSLMPL